LFFVSSSRTHFGAASEALLRHSGTNSTCDVTCDISKICFKLPHRETDRLDLCAHDLAPFPAFSRRWIFFLSAYHNQLKLEPISPFLVIPLSTMWFRVALSRVLVVALASCSSSASAFLPRVAASSSWRLFSSSSSSSTTTDTPTTLPTFDTKQSYLDFLEGVSALPQGFATGTASGTFVSQEAPAMGKLPISGTVIYLTEGATENWAAVFTKNKVRWCSDVVLPCCQDSHIIPHSTL